MNILASGDLLWLEKLLFSWEPRRLALSLQRWFDTMAIIFRHPTVRLETQWHYTTADYGCPSFWQMDVSFECLARFSSKTTAHHSHINTWSIFELSSVIHLMWIYYAINWSHVVATILCRGDEIISNFHYATWSQGLNFLFIIPTILYAYHDATIH